MNLDCCFVHWRGPPYFGMILFYSATSRWVSSLVLESERAYCIAYLGRMFLVFRDLTWKVGNRQNTSERKVRNWVKVISKTIKNRKLEDSTDDDNELVEKCRQIIAMSLPEAISKLGVVQGVFAAPCLVALQPSWLPWCPGPAERLKKKVRLCILISKFFSTFLCLPGSWP